MEKKSKKSIIIGVTVLLLVTLILLGLTYAYYRTRIEGNKAEKSISVQSKKMEITYLDGTSEFSTASEDTLIEPGFKFAKQFTVENTGDVSESYSILLDNIENTFTREDWKYYLYSGTYTIAEYEAGIDESNLVTEGVISNNAEELSIVDAIEIEPGETNKDIYTIVLVYENLEDVNQSDDMGATLSLRVNIGDAVVTWENATSGTLLYALRTNNEVTEPLTVPGQAASLETEAVLASTEDDYGTSYYYRGSVTNNYVTYSNMCWRIVRIQGDGSIKLVLADGAHPCGTANGYSADDTDSAFVADAEGNARTDIAYKASAAYDATDFPFANSDIPLVLSTWAEDNDLDMSQLVETEWCNDTAVRKQVFYDSDYNEVEAGSSLIAYTENYYGSYTRLYPVASAEPSLKCNTKGLDGSTGTEAIRYKNVLGVLSADELAFAGGIVFTANKNYYLYTNANGILYWTLSPYFLNANSSESYVWAVYSAGYLGSNYVSDIIGSVRPAVVLRSDVTIQEGGNGQIDTPYVLIDGHF